jgi:UPF0042 nucleotide-binding protein
VGGQKAPRERRRIPRAGRHSPPPRGGGAFVVVTGLSGSGKSQAIRALEDLGYFCVDNLPTMMIPTMAELSLRRGSEFPRVAIVVDVREGGFLSAFPSIWKQVKRMRGLKPSLIFLEARHDALVRRFSETRRPHPLAHNRPVSEGIHEERTRLNAIREMADDIVDTSDLTVHELRERFMSFARERAGRKPLMVTLLSFGFKHGVPVDADLVFDVRFLPNPHFVPDLKPLTGRDPAVVRFMTRHEATGQFTEKLTDMLRFLVPHYVGEGKSYLIIAIGCTGGRHRSVMLAEQLRTALADLEGVRIKVRHRDVKHPV